MSDEKLFGMTPDGGSAACAEKDQRIRELEAENKRLTAELIDAMEDVMNYTLNKRIGQLERRLEAMRGLQRYQPFMRAMNPKPDGEFVLYNEIEALLKEQTK